MKVIDEPFGNTIEPGSDGPLKKPTTCCVKVSESGVTMNTSGVPAVPTCVPWKVTSPSVLTKPGEAALAPFTVTPPPPVLVMVMPLAVVASRKLIAPVTVTLPLSTLRPGASVVMFASAVELPIAAMKLFVPLSFTVSEKPPLIVPPQFVLPPPVLTVVLPPRSVLPTMLNWPLFVVL